ncbi:MAG TPA: hypothetical protein VNW92_00625 [Polyangiaceae bacterium]|nr:hypothetical protein [Polyangiaceae bacterium]
MRKQRLTGVFGVQLSLFELSQVRNDPRLGSIAIGEQRRQVLAQLIV